MHGRVPAHLAPIVLDRRDQLTEIIRPQVPIIALIRAFADMTGRRFDLRFSHAASVHLGYNRMTQGVGRPPAPQLRARFGLAELRSEEHTSELQSLMRNSYAVFCLKKKKQN